MSNSSNKSDETIGKLWGTTRFLFSDHECVLAVAHGKQGGSSSLHFHEGKHNTFIVQRGTVEIWGESTMLATLHAGDSLVVAAGIHHRMVFASDAVFFELYHPVEGDKVYKDDIVRLSPGWAPENAPLDILAALRVEQQDATP